MPTAPQSLQSAMGKGRKQTSLEFSLKCSQTLWSRHFWWQTVPSSCCSDGECSVTKSNCGYFLYVITLQMLLAVCVLLGEIAVVQAFSPIAPTCL